MRISDWSSDVCSSDLALVVNNTFCLPDKARVSAYVYHLDFLQTRLARAPTDPLMAELIADGGQGYHNSSIRSEEHTSELQSLMRSSYAVFCLKTNKNLNCSTSFAINNTRPEVITSTHQIK